MKKLEKPPHSKHPKPKCTGCGKEFTHKELDEHILGIVRSLKV